MRELNIIARAIENGFEFQMSETFENVAAEAAEFLSDELAPDRYEECPIENGAYVYYDGKGYEKTCSGEFVSYQQTKYRFDDKGEPVPVEHYEDGYDDAFYFYDIVVNSDAQVVQLYSKSGC